MIRKRYYLWGNVCARAATCDPIRGFTTQCAACVGAAIAVEASDVALFTNDLRALLPVLALARTGRRKIAENITIAVVTKVGTSFVDGVAVLRASQMAPPAAPSSLPCLLHSRPYAAACPWFCLPNPCMQKPRNLEPATDWSLRLVPWQGSGHRRPLCQAIVKCTV